MNLQITVSNISYLYCTLLACGASLCFFFSYVLLGKGLSVFQVGSRYLRSRSYMGSAYLALAVVLLVFWASASLQASTSILFAFLLMSVHLITLLLILSYACLLGGHYVSSRFRQRDFGGWLVNSAVAWVGALFFRGLPFYIIAGITVVAYGAEVLRMMRVVKAGSEQKQVELDNFFSESAEEYMAWLRRSLRLLGATGVCCLLLFFCPLWTHLIYLAVLICALAYLFVTFLNYVVCSHSIQQAIHQAEALQTVPAKEENLQQEIPSAPETLVAPADEAKAVEVDDKATLTERLLRDNLNKWVMNGGYLGQVTLEELASELMTNRTYLSGYINNTYNCTFKEFIYMLRIEAAIQIMMDEPSINIEELGNRVGIPSPTTFNRQFLKQMGVTPAVWKMSNLQNKTN